jgi:hypothetical protein
MTRTNLDSMSVEALLKLRDDSERCSAKRRFIWKNSFHGWAAVWLREKLKAGAARSDYGNWPPLEEAEMDQYSPDVVRFALTQRSEVDSEAVDQTGRAAIALLKEAANVSKENVERALTVAHKLSMELRAAQDRIDQLEAEIKSVESRAARAEQWLQVIKKEIEEKLIAPMEANRPELPALH